MKYFRNTIYKKFTISLKILQILTISSFYPLRNSRNKFCSNSKILIAQQFKLDQFYLNNTRSNSLYICTIISFCLFQYCTHIYCIYKIFLIDNDPLRDSREIPPPRFWSYFAVMQTQSIRKAVNDYSIPPPLLLLLHVSSWHHF